MLLPQWMQKIVRLQRKPSMHSNADAKIAREEALIEKQKLRDEKKRLKDEAQSSKKVVPGTEAVDLGPAPNFAAYLSGR